MTQKNGSHVDDADRTAEFRAIVEQARRDFDVSKLHEYMPTPDSVSLGDLIAELEEIERREAAARAKE